MDISVADLACARRGIAVLEGVCFTVRAGAALILRGPNGIGKTTLLRTIAGLQPPLSGEVSAPADAVAYAAHADGVKAPLTVAENLRFWARICGTRDIARPLAAFDLAGLADRRAANLSAGQKRRLGLARMLVTGRPIWLFDEPTVSLDTAGSALFARAVEAHLAARGVALIATHADPGIAAATLDLAGFRARPREVPGFDRAFA